MNDKGSRTATATYSLSGVGIAVGVVLCVLQGIGTIDIGWFWATFPFWIVPAFTLAACLVIFVGVATFTAIYKNK